MSKPPLGSGGRFAALKSKLANQPGVTDPGALAASIGDKKYGAKKMGAMAGKSRQAPPAPKPAPKKKPAPAAPPTKYNNFTHMWQATPKGASFGTKWQGN